MVIESSPGTGPTLHLGSVKKGRQMQGLTVERLTMTLEECAVAIGVGRSMIFREARAGRLPYVRKVGSRYIVSRAALTEWLRLQNNGAGSGK